MHFPEAALLVTARLSPLSVPEELSRADRLRFMGQLHAELGSKLRSITRRYGVEVEDMGGTSSWTVRGSSEQIDRLRDDAAIFRDCGFELAPDDTFHAMPAAAAVG